MHKYWYPCFIYKANLQDDEASQQMESTQLAAAEIERLVEDKQRLAEHLQQEVLSGVALTWFLILFPSYSCFFLLLKRILSLPVCSLSAIKVYSVSTCTIQDTFCCGCWFFFAWFFNDSVALHQHPLVTYRQSKEFDV